MGRSIFLIFIVAYFFGNETIASKPLFLSEYLQKGQIKEAKELALVKHPELDGVKSYAGLFTIDSRYNSNSFFWFFESKSNPKKDPVLMWLNGGPGSSSMNAVFNYNGPFYLHKNLTTGHREYTLANNFSVIYLDNPVGTGYSFTEDIQGYAKNESDIDKHIVSFLSQFFTLFEEFRYNDFYVIGDSYSGKFCVTVPLAINRFNQFVPPEKRIYIKGSAMGNGLVNPSKQTILSEYIYQLGLVDWNGYDLYKKAEEVVELLHQLKESYNDPSFFHLYLEAKESKKKLFKLLTGYNYDQNLLLIERPEHKAYFEDYMVLPHVREALHVGDLAYDPANNTVMAFLINDLDKNETTAFEKILIKSFAATGGSFKVLAYNGNLDLIAPYISSEKYYDTLKWSGANVYRSAERKLWYVGKELAGYWKSAGNFHEVMVRNAGHVVSYDQPKWYMDMMIRFTRDRIPE